MGRLFDRFRPATVAPAPPPPDPDPLLGQLQRSVYAALGSLTTELRTLTHRVQLLDEASTSARAIEQRLMRLDTLATGTRALLEEQVQRLDASVNQLRGTLTGGSRGARRDRHAEEIGASLLEVLGPEQSAQLVQEIRARTANGVMQPSSPI